MFRFLVLNNHGSHDVEDLVKTYINILFSSVEVQIAEGYLLSANQLRNYPHYDLIFAEKPEAYEDFTRFHNTVSEHADWKVIFISKEADSYAAKWNNAFTLPALPEISSFYEAITSMVPNITKNKHDYVNHRWLINQDLPSVRILSVLKIIRREYRQNISLTDLAERVYVSPCYLSTTFSKFLGTSPMFYINQLRLDEAAKLLSTTTTRIAEICSYVGYSSPPYFCTCFKKRFGTTPAQYRLQHSTKV